MSTALHIGLSLTACVAITACGDDSDGGDNGSEGDGDAGDGDSTMLPDGYGDDPDRNAVGPDTLCERLAVIQCISERDCCSDPGRDLARCLEDQQTVCEDELLAPEISMTSAAGFNPEAAEDVFEELENLGRDCDPSLTSFSVSPDGFGRLYAGTVSPGGNCAPDNANERAMLGTALVSCVNRATHACQPGSSMWRCEPRKEEGGTCFSDNNCIDDHYCDNPSFGYASGTCKPRKADGSECYAFFECLSLACVDDVCTSATADTAYCFSR